MRYYLVMSLLPVIDQKRGFIFRSSLGNFPKFAVCGLDPFIAFRPDKFEQLDQVVSLDEFEIGRCPVKSNGTWTNWTTISPQDKSSPCVPSTAENHWTWAVDSKLLKKRQIFVAGAGLYAIEPFARAVLSLDMETFDPIVLHVSSGRINGKLVYRRQQFQRHAGQNLGLSFSLRGEDGKPPIPTSTDPEYLLLPGQKSWADDPTAADDVYDE
jgi:hypothetical protein